MSTQKHQQQIIEQMSKIEELKQTYLKDADLMASKSRFGYFSIPLNANAGLASTSDKKFPRDQNGRVITEPRNIFSGVTATGVLKKSFFNFQRSVFQGDPYTDPDKKESVLRLQESKKLQGKDIYKPPDTVKTSSTRAAYDHIAQKPIQKKVKDCVDENGKVITQPRNITTNPGSQIEKFRLKQIKYVPDPYQNFLQVQRQDSKKSIQLRGQAPFRSSSPLKKQFYTSRQTYGEDQSCLVKAAKKNKESQKGAEHESTFKPSCTKKFDTFSYPDYMPGGQKPKQKKTISVQETKQKFKVRSSFQNSKPCPSISTFRSNILRNIR